MVISAQFLLDSESSKTSDFRRMDRAERDTVHGADTPAETIDHGAMGHGRHDGHETESDHD